MPTKLSPTILLAVWDRAKEAEIGIAVETNLPKELRYDLLAARREAKREDLADLMTFIPEGRSEVFIAHKSVELPE